MGPDVVLVSSAEETAFEVRACLGVTPGAESPAVRRVQFLTSGDVAVFRRLAARFLGPEVEHVEGWSWN